MEKIKIMSSGYKNKRVKKIINDGLSGASFEVEVDEKGVIKSLTLNNPGPGSPHWVEKRTTFSEKKKLPEEVLYKRNLVKHKLPEGTRYYDTDFGLLWFNRKIMKWCNMWGEQFNPTVWFEKI